MPNDAQPIDFALNHVSVPRLSCGELFALASSLGCTGVELRTDLGDPLFGSETPETIGRMAGDHDLRIHALAEVSRFNEATPEVLASVAALAENAQRSGASAIILIPLVGCDATSDDQLCRALDQIGNELKQVGMRALIEPIGFAASSLRDFDQVRRAIDATHGTDRFGMVHDTFHHFLAGGGPLSSRHVDIVHVSGVTAAKPMLKIEDGDRGFVGTDDRLGTVEQLRVLFDEGYGGPISMEAFSPLTQTLSNPEVALRASFDFMRSALMYNDT